VISSNEVEAETNARRSPPPVPTVDLHLRSTKVTIDHYAKALDDTAGSAF
jgi:hypothetical protein